MRSVSRQLSIDPVVDPEEAVVDGLPAEGAALFLLLAGIKAHPAQGVVMVAHQKGYSPVHVEVLSTNLAVNFLLEVARAA